MGAVSGGLGGMSGSGLNTALMGPSTATGMAGTSSIASPLAGATPLPKVVGSSGLATGGGYSTPGVDTAITATRPATQGAVDFSGSFNQGIDQVYRNLGTVDPTTGLIKDASTMEVAKTLGSPVASLGLGGLEESDFINTPDFDDPRDKYNPYSKLDLSRDTGISEAMSRDTGLRLLAKGGAVDQEQKAYDERMGGFLTNITTPPPGTAQFAREMQEYHRKRNTEILGNPRDYTRAERLEAANSLQGSGDTQYFNDVQNNKIEDGYAKGGYLKGPGDGMSDDIPATINGDEPAALADGEFVVPADVVSHLGNGSSEAGSKQLYAMMARIRKARTGNKSQGKEIKPGKYMPR
jgi:hypothetical protein